jgi:uncharacterized protein (TIGR02284 family)
LQTVFLRRAQDCASAVTDLQQPVARHGGKPEKECSVAGAAHRGWLNLKAAVSGRPDLAILEECERGEDVARYRKALEEPLPEDIRMVVQRQYDGVVRNHDQIRNLRDSYRAAKES